MVLVHARTLGIARREIVDAAGYERARAIFTRQGYESGAMDAEISRKVRPSSTVADAFAVGPQLHALEGAVLVEPVTVQVDVAGRRFYAEYLWRNSSECAEHVAVFGTGHQPAGWSQIGYASGYASIFLGRPIVYRETECIAMGHPHCRVVGRPAEEWEDAKDDLRYMRSEQLLTAKFLNTSPQTDSKAGNRWQIVGASAGFNVAFDMLRHVSDTDATVLFQGESGVGKEMFARNLHAMSQRADKPFVAVNCAAIAEGLVEAELFGVERGAFTGASVTRPGRFERADGGTLFLDEIGTLTLSAQAKLLRALQEGEFERVGDTRPRSANVRLIAATNTDLREEVAAGRFRTDLFYRLNVFPLQIPPLRERRADIPLLMEHFLEIYRHRYSRAVPGFDERAVATMLGYDWPGNVRELENVIARGVILARDGEPLGVHQLFVGGERLGNASFSLAADGSIHPQETADRSTSDLVDELLDRSAGIDRVEEEMLRRALSRTKGNRSAAARLLHLSRAQFNYRIDTKVGTSRREDG
jgi:transcriptional regulator with GAF, ATPase, and Fis domain